ncbi:MAG TPA: type II CAAX endopeptidase family protein [Longimicrobium sp.]|jgi:membrane protease YdiL (CAAX protease family)
MDSATRPERRPDPHRLLRAAAAVLKALVLGTLWIVLSGMFLVMPPAAGGAWIAAVAGFFLWFHASGRGPGGRRRQVLGRVRPVPRPARRWVGAFLLALPPAVLAMGVALAALGLMDEPVAGAFEAYARRPGGIVVLVAYGVGVAPLLEEFVFRGWTQRPLERLFGAAWAIPVTSLLFALFHFEPEGLPIRLAGSLVMGYAVYATRSIWAGVALHAAWNGLLFAADAAFRDFDPFGAGLAVALPAALVLLACAAWIVRAAPRLRAAARLSGAAEAA